MTIEIVPESAPFSSEQRAWLNGFLAGMIGMIDSQQAAQGGTSVSLAAAAAILNPPLGSASTSLTESDVDQPVDLEETPWHDSSISIADRLKLAEGKAPASRMMAAMAQLDCGTCGYLCKTYAEAIALGKEKSLTLCTPGGSETAKALRKLSKELNASPNFVGTNATSKAKHESTETSTNTIGTRDQPAIAKLILCERLNREGSAKDTRHVEIDLSGTSVRYKVGDALGVFPVNCSNLVRDVIKAASLDETPSLLEALSNKCLRSIPVELIELAVTNVTQRPKLNGAVQTDTKLISSLQTFLESDDLDHWDLLEFLHTFPGIVFSVTEFLDAIPAIRPRLYSIASSQSIHPNAVHLTVGRVENVVRQRARKGVASTFLADRTATGNSLKVFVHPSHGFTLPSNPTAPMIMVGPGTGIAPFMAFLQQRLADGAQGKNWLFFGDQKCASDYLYQETLEGWTAKGLLTKLDLAFSRDSDEKVYVQHRMKQNANELFEWLEAGAYFFVCGDAQRMAVDVDLALKDVIASVSGKGLDFAREYVKSLSQQNRYARDVY